MDAVFILQFRRYTPCVRTGKASAIFKLAALHDFIAGCGDREGGIGRAVSVDVEIRADRAGTVCKFQTQPHLFHLTVRAAHGLRLNERFEGAAEGKFNGFPFLYFHGWDNSSFRKRRSKSSLAVQMCWRSRLDRSYIRAASIRLPAQKFCRLSCRSV